MATRPLRGHGCWAGHCCCGVGRLASRGWPLLCGAQPAPFVFGEGLAYTNFSTTVMPSSGAQQGSYDVKVSNTGTVAASEKQAFVMYRDAHAEVSSAHVPPAHVHVSDQRPSANFASR